VCELCAGGCKLRAGGCELCVGGCELCAGGCELVDLLCQVAKNKQLSPKVGKLESALSFLTSQSCPPPSLEDCGCSAEEMAKLKEQVRALFATRMTLHRTNFTRDCT